VHPLIRLGIELPPLRDDDPRSFALSVTDVALAVERAGVATLWLAEGGPGGLDPGPLAGSLAVATTALGIGVLVRPSRGRHPSVLARDVSTIDRLSGGRAVVGLVEDGTGPLDVERLREATALVHRLLAEEEVSISGRFYEVAELTTRPRPVHDGGPPVVAGLTGSERVGEPAEGAVIAAGGDACVTGGGPSQVADSRARLDGVAPAGENPVLLWRGELLGRPAAAAVGLAESVLDAGADGLIAVLGTTAVAGASFDRGAVDDLLEALHPLMPRLLAG
jgi:alkanesulfonate monooxygenase SsuD/methylene tetrahydromethanopterin reductase-like flavin-dependent oxidoreductase (luciferase family)